MSNLYDITDYYKDKYIEEFKKLLDENGNPHPSSNKYRDLSRRHLMEIAYEAGFKDGIKEGLAIK